MEAQDLITRRCGECLSCRGALRRRGAWRGAATTSALGSRWQRAPSAGRRRPRSRQGGGKRHGREMREGSRDEDPRNLGFVGASKKKAAGSSAFGWCCYIVCFVSMCPKTRAQTLILHTWRSTCSRTHGRDETRVALTALSYRFSFVCVYLFVR